MTTFLGLAVLIKVMLLCYFLSMGMAENGENKETANGGCGRHYQRLVTDRRADGVYHAEVT